MNARESKILKVASKLLSLDACNEGKHFSGAINQKVDNIYLYYYGIVEQSEHAGCKFYNFFNKCSSRFLSQERIGAEREKGHDFYLLIAKSLKFIQKKNIFRKKSLTIIFWRNFPQVSSHVAPLNVPAITLFFVFSSSLLFVTHTHACIISHIHTPLFFMLPLNSHDDVLYILSQAVSL